MAGYKETPRQKMIGMLYLVLTALLALNVSKDILDAFLVVNDSMENTNESFSTKIASAYAQFENQYQLNPGKVEEYWNQAQEIRRRSDELINYIDKIKLEVVARSEKVTEAEALSLFYREQMVSDPMNPGEQKKKMVLNLVDVPTKDKFDEATNYMVGQNKNGKAYELAGKMEDFRNYILSIIGTQYNDKIGLVTKKAGGYRDATGTSQDWEYYNFFHTILAANVTILNKIIAEVQNAEFDAVNRLYANITEKDFKFDNVVAKVIPRSTFVLSGQSYEAEILVAAYDSKTQSEVKVLRGVSEVTDANIGRAQVFKSEAGTVKLQFPASSEGPQQYAGIIEMRDPSTQEIVRYSFDADYIVAPPSLTVAPLKMNVFYVGVKNPISISAPGIPMEKVVPTISKGKLSRNANGTWDVEVPAGETKTTISASATMDNKSLPLGSSEFRIKRVPDPVAMIAGKLEGAIDKNSLLAAGAIIPTMRDFDFELYFEVTSFTFATIVNGDWIPRNIRGNRFTEEVQGVIRNAQRKQKFFFENIQAKGPDGTVRSLNTINLEIN
ncbi:MAG: GldM family protein [Bacteroidales bacterium]|nr:GldM family protein [Bacteroidales bacterium]